ncbi:hypothetical protein Ancab_039715 [Ancistrocladus abbreviatus]
MVKECLQSLFGIYSSSLDIDSHGSTSLKLVQHKELLSSSALNDEIEDELTSRLNMKFKKIMGSGYVDKSELDRYLDEEFYGDIDASFDILIWWKLNALRYLILSAMARDMLAMPISTVASESAFNTGSRVLDFFRSSLTLRLVEALVCLQDWLRKSHVPSSVEETLQNLKRLENDLLGMQMGNQVAFGD